MKIVYMGTPEFAVPALNELINSKHDVLAVVTQPDRMKGRGKKIMFPPVKDAAVNAGIEVLQPEKIKGNEAFLKELKELSPDIMVVAAYGKILPKEVLDVPKYGCLNIHASLLPRWRGAAPMQHALLSGDEMTGVTIMKMAEGLDTGDMIRKGEISTQNEYGPMYYPTLSDALSKLGARMIVEVLDDFERGELDFDRDAETQDDSKSTYAGMIKKEDGKITFDSMTPAEIERMIRAYEPWPGAYAVLNGQQIKFKRGVAIDELTDDAKDRPFGAVLQADNSGIYIKAKDGVFQLTELQIPGKNWMDAGSYLRGHKLEVGEIFE